MVGEASDAGADIALNAMSGRATVTARNVYVMLLTSGPSDTDTIDTADANELTTPGTNGYDREQVTWGAPTGSPTRRVENDAEVVYGAFTADLASVSHCALVSAATGTSGDFIYYWTLDAARDPQNGDTIRFAAGALRMQGD